MTVTIGITGGIGSGKTMVCEIFRLLGIPVFQADVVAGKLINSDAVIRNELISLYGHDIYNSDRKINREKLAGIIFNNDAELEKVNKVVHPAVRNEYMNWVKNQESEYVIHEAAILFESGFYKMMDFTILVTAPEEMRIERVMKRNGLTRENVISRIDRQWPDSEKRKIASVELINDNKSLLIPQIIEIDKKIKTNGKIW
jgi:dephospho-CoA kinase